jgi:hypothetical protein
MDINVSIKKILGALYLTLGVLFAGSLAVHGIGHATGRWGLGGLSNLFNLDSDQGAPTWFNSLLLFLLFTLTWLIAHFPHPASARLRVRWKFLGIVFLLMSVDEVAMVHEAIGRAIGTRFELTGYLYFPFLIPGLILAGALFIAYVPFLRTLPRDTAIGMAAAGAIYLSGAALVEALSANRYYHLQQHDLVYRFLVNIEEVLEMTGLLVLFKVLGDYLLSLSPAGAPEWRIRLGR